jgi:MYXO-CTERM domain-containing protein
MAAAAAVLSAGFAVGTVGCSDASSPGSPSSGEVTGNATEGELIMYVATMDDGTSEHRYGLRQAAGPELTLLFDNPPASFSSGMRLRVSGAIDGTTMHVDNFEQLASAETVQAVEQLPAQETYAFVLVNLNDAGVNVTPTQANTAMFGTGATDKSFAEYYAESSYGKYTATGAVVGPFNYTLTTCANADTTAMATAIEPQIPQTYNHYVYYFGSRQTVCQFGGLGEEGAVGRPAKRTWINGSDSCVVLMQEPGHNIGLMHGNTMTCGTAATITNTPVTDCTVTEYGSRLTTMGSGCRDFNGYERWYEQWLAGCGGVKVTSTGTFNLLPLEMNCPSGVQVLQVPMPATRTIHDPQATTTNVNLNNYYVELRTPTGPFDTGLTPTLAIYASDNVRTGNQNSVWTELLDMNPANNTGNTPTIDMLQVGQTFTDPTGSPSITLNSISSSLANVTVTFTGATGAAPTCIDGTMLSGSGPTTCIGSDGGIVVPPPQPDGGTTVADAGVRRDAGATSDASIAATDGGRDATAPSDGAAGSSSSSSTSTTSASGTTSTSSRSASTTSRTSTSSEDTGNNGGNHSGCSCDAAGSSTSRTGAFAPLALLALVALRSRRRGTARAA